VGKGRKRHLSFILSQAQGLYSHTNEVRYNLDKRIMVEHIEIYQEFG